MQADRLQLLGFPSRATVDLTAQATNISSTPLFSVPINSSGLYLLCGYTVITQAATTTSNLPSIGFSYTDNDSGVVISGTLFTNSVSTNTVGTTNSATTNTGSPTGVTVFDAKANTTILYSTSSYSSTGATPMQYALHLRLFYIG